MHAGDSSSTVSVILAPKEVSTLDRDIPWSLRKTILSAQVDLKLTQVKNEALAVQIQSQNADLERLQNELIEERQKRVVEFNSHQLDLDSVNANLANSRDCHYSESCKSSFLAKELEKSRNEVAILNRDLQEVAKTKAQLQSNLEFQHIDHEKVVLQLNAALRETTRYNLRLQEEAVQSERTNDRIEKTYSTALEKLNSENEILKTRVTDQQNEIAEITKERDFLKLNLAQFTSNPSAQYKLTSDLFAAYIASEDQIKEFEKKEREFEAQKKEQTKIMQHFSDEVGQLRAMTEEYQSSLERLERQSNQITSDQIANRLQCLGTARSDGEMSDEVASLTRQLRFYRSESESPEKRAVVELICQSSEFFERFMMLSEKEAVLYAFLAEHNATDHVAAITELKNDLKVKNCELEFHKNEIDRLLSIVTELQRSSGLTIQDLESKIQSASLTELNVVSLTKELEQTKKLREIDAAELKKKIDALEIELVNTRKDRQQLLQELTESVTREKETATNCLKSQASLSSVNIELTVMKEHQDYLEATLQQLEHSSNFDQELILTEVNMATKKLENLKATIGDYTDLSLLLARANGAEEKLHLAEIDLDAYRQSDRLHKESAAKLQSEVDELREHLTREQQSHHACSKDYYGRQSEIDILAQSVKFLQSQNSQLAKNLEKREETHSNVVKQLEDKIKLLQEQISNCGLWKNAFYLHIEEQVKRPEVVSRTIDFHAVMKYIGAENELLRSQLNLAERDYNFLKSSVNWEQNKLKEMLSTVSVRTPENIVDLVWQNRYNEARDYLKIVIATAENLRSDLVQVRAELQSARTEITNSSESIQALQSSVNAKDEELDALHRKLAEVGEQLQASKRRFESDIQRQEIERLRKALTEFEQKKKTDAEKAKQFYSNQLKDHMKNSQDIIRTKEDEIVRIRSEMEKALQEKDKELSNQRHQETELIREIEKKSNDMVTLQRRIEIATKSRANLVEQHKAETLPLKEMVEQLKLDLRAAGETISRLNAEITAHPRVSSQITTQMLDSVPALLSVSACHSNPIAPVAAGLGPSLSRSTAVISPQTQMLTSLTIQRVTPQLRASDPAPPFASHCSPSVQSGSNPELLTALSPPSAKSGIISDSWYDESRMPSTSSGQKRTRETDSDVSVVMKRQRENSPTSSDVISSTVQRKGSQNFTPMRIRLDSRSAGSDHPEELPRSVSMEIGSSERSVASEAAQNLENQVTESVEMSRVIRVEATDDNLLSSEPDQEENPADAFGDEDTGGSYSDLQTSDENGSPVACISDHAPEEESDALRLESSQSISCGILERNQAQANSERHHDEQASALHVRQSGSPSNQSSYGPRPTLRFSRLPSPLSVVQAPSHQNAPRTPGFSLMNYDASDDAFGVVPSTPQMLPSRQDDEIEILPQVPFFSFGSAADAVEDVTASQVPPTPHAANMNFFGQRQDASSEDSEDSINALNQQVEVEEGNGDDGANVGQSMLSPMSLNEPTVPSPGSAYSADDSLPNVSPRIPSVGNVSIRRNQSSTIGSGRSTSFRGRRLNRGLPVSPRSLTIAPVTTNNSPSSSTASLSPRSSLLPRRPIEPPSSQSAGSDAGGPAGATSSRGVTPGLFPRGRGRGRAGTKRARAAFQ